MVEVNGFEPMTPCLHGRGSTSCAIPPSILTLAFAGDNIKRNAPLVGMHSFVLKMNKKETSVSVSTENG